MSETELDQQKEDCAELREEFVRLWTRKLQPRDRAESLVVTDIAHVQWTLSRCRALEYRLLQAEAGEAQTRAIELLHTSEHHYRQAFEQGLKALERLRAFVPAPLPPPAHERRRPVSIERFLALETPALTRPAVLPERSPANARSEAAQGLACAPSLPAWPWSQAA